MIRQITDEKLDELSALVGIGNMHIWDDEVCKIRSTPLTTFQPDTYHCPESCLCGMCRLNEDCEEACEEYKIMVNKCNECETCKVKDKP